MKVIVNLIVILTLILAPSLLLAHGSDEGCFKNMMGFPMMNYFFGWGMPLMFLFWFLVILGIILLIKYLVQQQSPRDQQKNDALEILKERYAKGEIKEEEFKKIKKDLIA